MGFGTELLFTRAFRLAVLGPKRLHILLAHVARGLNLNLGNEELATAGLMLAAEAGVDALRILKNDLRQKNTHLVLLRPSTPHIPGGPDP